MFAGRSAMGIHDRDYYRDEGPSIFQALMPRGRACRWLIGINIGVFVLQLLTQALAQQPEFAVDGVMRGQHGSGQGIVTDWLILNVDAVLNGQVWRLLTYAFLHDTSPNRYFLHLIFNMLLLWWFGSDVEQIYGAKEFTIIYLVSAFLGGLAYEIWGLTYHWGNTPAPPCLGASGAVTTMLVLCALHHPRRVILLFAVIPMPIWAFALMNVLFDLFGFFGYGSKGVAFCVHLAGAGFAVAYYKWQRSFVETFQGILRWKPSRSRVRLKLFDPDEDNDDAVAVSAHLPPHHAVDEHLEAKVDALLEKIAQHGKESLTSQEQEILRRAAELYKRRRT